MGIGRIQTRKEREQGATVRTIANTNTDAGQETRRVPVICNLQRRAGYYQAAADTLSNRRRTTPNKFHPSAKTSPRAQKRVTTTRRTHRSRRRLNSAQPIRIPILRTKRLKRQRRRSLVQTRRGKAPRNLRADGIKARRGRLWRQGKRHTARGRGLWDCVGGAGGG